VGPPVRRPELIATLLGDGCRRTPALLLGVLILLLPLTATAATPAGTRIINRANVTYETGGIPDEPKVSNPAEIVTRSPATLEFLKYAPAVGGTEKINVEPTSYSSSGTAAGPFASLAPTLPSGLSNPVPLIVADSYHAGQPVFLRLSDADQNLDPATQESVLIRLVCADSGDMEWLLLTETGPDSGAFAGYIPSTAAATSDGDGALSVVENCRLDASYTDSADGSDAAASTAFVDPTGIVFDSVTGQPLDGAQVTLIDAATGQPATVFGDDGFSSFPATVTTGGSVSDSSGTVYNFAQGAFRFPLIAPGSYHLDVVPPAGYSVYSAVADSAMQTLPGAPFALTTGSRNEVFVVNPGPVVRIDIPADPSSGPLWLRKETNVERVATGDFIQYRLTLENNLSAIAPGSAISDRLPAAMRYQEGSTQQNGKRTADPTISSDGRSLTFNVGDIGAGQSVTLSYVVEVTLAARPGRAVNRATAADTLGHVSNLARASINIESAFFNDTTFLAGRVLAGACGETANTTGIEGARIYLEDGSYSVTDRDGRYHFEGVEPGVHVVQLDTASLPSGYDPVPCAESSQSAGRAFSQFVDLRGGTLWRVDFNAVKRPPPQGEVGIEMTASLDGESAAFTIGLDSASVSASNLRLTVMLPGGASYRTGSAKLAETPVEPQVMDGALTFRFEQLDPGQPLSVTFDTQLDALPGSEELPARALLLFDTAAHKGLRSPVVETRFKSAPGVTRSEEIKLYPRFPSFVAELQPTDRTMLEQLAERLRDARPLRIEVIGHTDNQPVAARSRQLFADNQALSEARAASVAKALTALLDIPSGVITQRGMGESMPVADNSTEQGRALNRRVELNIVVERQTATPAVTLSVPSSGRKVTATTGADPTDNETAEIGLEQSETAPTIDEAWWRSHAGDAAGFAWPAEGYVPSSPSTTLMVLFPSGDKPAATLNGVPVSARNLAGIKSSSDGNHQLAIWRGVDLVEGLNRFEVIIKDREGKVVTRQQRQIWYIDTFERVTLLAGQSRLIADGVRPPVIALRLTDTAGHTVRPGRYVDLSLNAPYTVRRADQFEETADGTGRKRFATGADGTLLVELEPTTSSGEVELMIPLADGTQRSVSAWLKPAMRDWILVGFAEGTVGYNTLSGNQTSLDEAGLDEHDYDNGRVKFFAKGAIKGEWLLTMAYDSNKRDSDGDSLQQQIDPDRYYPLYGDGTRQGYEASSARKLYVKLERDQFYALFGDMQTGLDRTELSRYSRSMNGFKSELQGESFSYTVFAADTKQAFAKDELRGNGTSGRYELSQKGLVINSETVTIETRDRLHSEQVLEEQTLTRHIDYDIDYDTGSLFFKRPVPSRDESFNPVYIVVRYETDDSSEANLNYGGRAALKLLDGKVEVGASYVHEEQGAGEGELYGADATIKLNEQTTLRAEAATTDTSRYDSDVSGDAYLAEVSHEGDKLTGRAYYREQQTGFGLGQQNGSESGMRKYGTQGSYRIGSSLSLVGEAFHEDNLASAASRDVAQLEGRYKGERYGLHSGLRTARDRFDDGDTRLSNQLLVGGNWTTADGRLNLRSDYEQALGGSNENSDYPTLLTLGADYRLTEKSSVFAEQEFSWGKDADSVGTRAGFKSSPWQGADLQSSVEQQFDENGERVFALFGLGQSWQVSEAWSVDFSIDRSQTLRDNPRQAINSSAPPAHGDGDDFTALSLGATRKVDKWSWWNRLETRQGESEEKYGVSTGLVGEPRKGVAVSAKALAFIALSSSGSRKSDGDIRLGLAYRPDRSRWIVLNRLDFYFDRETGSDNDYDNWRIVNHLHTNFRASRRLQMSFYYGLKYVRDSFNGASYSGFTDLIAFEARYNITKRWDVGLHASLLHSWNSGQFDYSLGSDIGYSPLTNTWLSLGYNFVGFSDEDFADANYTAQGAYLRFRAKFDQQSVREAAGWLNR
jgi:uncharacterized repeat protein (TIGR01451 family)